MGKRNGLMKELLRKILVVMLALFLAGTTIIDGTSVRVFAEDEPTTTEETVNEGTSEENTDETTSEESEEETEEVTNEEETPQEGEETPAAEGEEEALPQEETTEEVTTEEQPVSDETTPEESEEETEEVEEPEMMLLGAPRAAGITDWAALDAAIQAAAAGDTIELDGNLLADHTIKVDKDITLTGNFTIYRDGSAVMGPMFNVEAGTFTLDEGLTLSGKTAAGQAKSYTKNDIKDETRGFFIEVETNGKLVINGATIRDYTTRNSRHSNRDNQPQGVSPIFVAGEFEMNKGSIVHNWASAVDRDARRYDTTGAWLNANTQPFASHSQVVRYNSALTNEDGYEDGTDYGADLAGWQAVIKNGENEVLAKTNAGAIFIDAPGKTSNINGGVISDNAGHAGAIVVAGGKLNINDGTIGGDTRPTGFVNTFNSNESQGNWADHFGTVYVVSSDAEVRMCGGTIKNNTTVQGGGVFVTNQATFFLLGGTIEGNNTMQNGGGILIYSDNVYLLSGYIKNNRAPLFGGGVYLYGDDQREAYQYTTTLHNAEITGNSAESTSSEYMSADRRQINDDAFRNGSGGGIWLCPAGTVEFDGSTINLFDNNATNQGKDFHKDAGFDGGVLIDFGPHAHLAQTEGDDSDWIHDEMNSPLNGLPLTVTEATNGESGRLSIYNKEKRVNVGQPALHITGNISRRGGGLGSDGSVLFIKPTNEDQDIDKGSLSYTKTFKDMAPRPMEYEMVLADEKGDPVIGHDNKEVIVSLFRLYDKQWASNYENDRKTNGTPIFGQLLAYWPEGMAYDDADGFWKVTSESQDKDFAKIQLTFPSGMHGINYFDASEEAPKFKIIMREYEVDNGTRGKQVSTQIFDSTDPEFVDTEDTTDKNITIYDGETCCQVDCDPGTPTTFRLRYRTFNYKAEGTNEEKPEIEKYVDEAVHKDIHFNDEFTYNILAYVTTDADSLVVTDKLDKQLEFASIAADIKIYDLGVKQDGSTIDSNHLPVYTASSDPINNGNKVPSVKTGTDIGTNATWIARSIITENGQSTLKVSMDDGVDPNTGDRDRHDVEGLRGHWIRIEFKARLKEELRNKLANHEMAVSQLTFENVDATAGDDGRNKPNTGNDPVISDESHSGIGNTASYEIKVKNQAKYNDKSNKVTVKPEEPEIEKYVNEAVHDYIAIDEEFTYDIMAYVTKAADKVTITDKLDSRLELVSNVVVTDMGKDNNHKPTNDIYSDIANPDSTLNTVASTPIASKDYSVSITDNNLVVTLDDKVEIDSTTGTTTREKDVVKNLRGHWVRVTFTVKFKNGTTVAELTPDYVEIKDADLETRAEPNKGNDPVVSDEDHEGIANKSSYEIEIGNEVKYEDESNTVTVQPEEPEIEKYVNEAVHEYIGLKDTFTYDVIAYVSKDADRVIITDELNEQLELVSTDPANIKVFALDEENNHKVTNDIVNNKVNNDATVAENGNEISDEKAVERTVEIENGKTKLTVSLNDGVDPETGDRDYDLVKGLRGKWVKVTFEAKIKDGLKISDLNFTEIKDTDAENRAEPNLGNDPVESDEDHSGVPNKASYIIQVDNEGRYEDESNTVTVEPEEPEIEKYINEAVHEYIAIDEEFTYDIMAYVTNTADKVTITDELDKRLELVGEVTVSDMGADDNHKPTNNIYSEKVNTDSTISGTGNAITEFVSNVDADNKLVVTLDDQVTVDADGHVLNREKHVVEGLRGHWVRVTFTVKFKDGTTIDVLTPDFVTIDPTAVEKRDEPNVGNAPVVSDEEHTGIANKSSYEIEIGNKVKYDDESNTVTVQPEEPEIEKYINEAVHEFVGLEDVFTYDIMAYVTNTADSFTITDELNSALEFVDTDSITVMDMGEDNNHKPTNDIYSEKVNDDATVSADGNLFVKDTDYTITTDNNTLVVTFDDEVKIDEETGTKSREKDVVQNLRGHWVKVTFQAKFVEGTDISTLEFTQIDENTPVLSNEAHDGIPNKATYEVKVNNEPKYTDESNTVTVKPEEPEVEKYVNEAVHQYIALEDEFTYDVMAYVTNRADKVIINDSFDERLEFVNVDDITVMDMGEENNHKPTNNIYSVQVNDDSTVSAGGTLLVKEDDYTINTAEHSFEIVLDDEVVVDEEAGEKTRGKEVVKNLRGHWLKVTFTVKFKEGTTIEELVNDYVFIDPNQVEDRALANVGNAPVVSDEAHEGIPNKASNTIVVANGPTYSDQSNTVTVQPQEPEIEKYINQAVHKDIALEDEFTYDILAYITKDADSAEITDELVKDLQFVSSASDVTVEDLGAKNNHKPEKDINSTVISTDATVTESGDPVDANVNINGQLLTVTIPDATAHRGHWVKVTFVAKIKDGKEIEDLNQITISASETEDRAVPNVGNDPVLSDEDHTGVPNTAGYTITVNNEAKYKDLSNTVTVKPVKDAPTPTPKPTPAPTPKPRRKVPNTSDTNGVATWAWILMISLLGGAYVVYTKRKYNS